jgi:hypothetical protein
VAYREETLKKWRDWAARIKDDVLQLFWRREIWQGLVEQLDKRKIEDSGYFKVAWVRMYVESLAAAVRRHADIDDDSVSLARLMDDLGNQAPVFTRDLFMSEVWDMDRVEHDEELQREVWRRHGHESFDRWAGPGGTHIDAAKMWADLEKFRKTTEGVVHYVNRSVAHLDRRGVERTLTFGELDAALESLKELFGEYYALVTATGLVLDPVMQGDWKAPFRVALFSPTE